MFLDTIVVAQYCDFCKVKKRVKQQSLHLPNRLRTPCLQSEIGQKIVNGIKKNYFFFYHV